MQQKSTVANKSAVHLSGQKDVQGSNVKDRVAAICGGDGLHLVVSDSDEEGPAPAPNYVRPPHSLRDKGAVEQLYVKLRELRHLGNGTSDHRNENPKTLFNTNYPPKPGENHLRNHFRPLESVFSANATYKTRYNFLDSQLLIFFLHFQNPLSKPE